MPRGSRKSASYACNKELDKSKDKTYTPWPKRAEERHAAVGPRSDCAQTSNPLLPSAHPPSFVSPSSPTPALRLSTTKDNRHGRRIAAVRPPIGDLDTQSLISRVISDGAICGGTDTPWPPTRRCGRSFQPSLSPYLKERKRQAEVTTTASLCSAPDVQPLPHHKGCA